jgi:SAM-dependent methyltransferase
MSEIEFLSPAAAVSMADEWFKLADRDHFWMRWRFDILRRQMRRFEITPGRAMEIGCGHGVLRQQMEDLFKVPVDGCDLNQHALRMAPTGLGRLLVYNILDRLPEMCGAYDMVLLMDVIEHLDDDLGFLQASLQHLKPGGIVAINVPAHMALYSKYDRVAGHKRRYNSQRIHSLFGKSNVTALTVVNWGFPMVPLLVVRKLALKFVSEERTIGAGFVPPGRVMKAALGLLQGIETRIPVDVPIGTSIMALGRLNESTLHKA